MSASAVQYRKLLVETTPRAIHTDGDNEKAIKLFERLSEKPHATQAEQQLMELLAVLIEHYEEKHYRLKPAKPEKILAALMGQHGLKQKDLVDVFRTPSIVSEVLSGKRSLTTEHIRKLAAKFHISPAVFF